MNNIKKSIFKTFVDNTFIPPEPECFCDTCVGLEQCYSLTAPNNIPTGNIWVRYTPESTGRLTDRPIGSLISSAPDEDHTTYYICSTAGASILDIVTGNLIVWEGGSFSNYECP